MFGETFGQPECGSETRAQLGGRAPQCCAWPALGTQVWRRRTVEQLGLDYTMRPPGRPPERKAER